MTKEITSSLKTAKHYEQTVGKKTKSRIFKVTDVSGLNFKNNLYDFCTVTITVSLLPTHHYVVIDKTIAKTTNICASTPKYYSTSEDEIKLASVG